MVPSPIPVTLEQWALFNIGVSTDTIPPVVSLNYSNENCTNGNVIATISSDKPITIANVNWTTTDEGLTYEKTFGANTEETVDYSLTSNPEIIGTKTVVITNIDTQIAPPHIEITPSNNEWSKTKRLTMTFSDELEVTVGDDWTQDPNNLLKFHQDFEKDTLVVVQGTDCAGNSWSSEISIEKIDNTPPVIASITHAVQADSTALITVTATDVWSGISGYSLDGGSYQSGNTFTVAQNGAYTLTVQDLAGNTASQTHTISDIPFPSGINKIVANAIKIYPNPVKGELKIEPGELRIKNIQITDVSGRTIANCQLSIVNSIDVSHLSSGVYLIKIETDKGIITEKFVKE